MHRSAAAKAVCVSDAFGKGQACGQLCCLKLLYRSSRIAVSRALIFAPQYASPIISMCRRQVRNCALVGRTWVSNQPNLAQSATRGQADSPCNGMHGQATALSGGSTPPTVCMTGAAASRQPQANRRRSSPAGD